MARNILAVHLAHTRSPVAVILPPVAGPQNSLGLPHCYNPGCSSLDPHEESKLAEPLHYCSHNMAEHLYIEPVRVLVGFGQLPTQSLDTDSYPGGDDGER